jgi:transposase
MQIQKTLDTYIFSSDEIAELKDYRDSQNDPDLKCRFIALLLLAEKMGLSKTASVIGKSVRTVKRRFKKYFLKGPAALNSFYYKPKKPYLTEEQVKETAAWVKENRPANIGIVREFIGNRFNIQYSDDAVRKLLKNEGLKFLRPRLAPGKPPTEEEQRRFVEEYEEIRQFAGTGTVVLFCDAMHLVHQTEPSRCWGDPKDPPVFPTNSGRRRLNILGAYSPSACEFIHHTGEANCDSDQVIVFFEKILKAYPGAPFIVLYLDNASYFHAEAVSEWLERHPQFICRFLPPYAPNLNLIERLWRFVKKHLVKNRYFEKYKTFRCNVFRLLNNISEYKDEILPLITEKFEIVTYMTA